MGLSPSDVMRVVEVAHRGQPDSVGWLDDLLEVLRGLVPATQISSAAIVQRHADHYELLAGDTAAHAQGPLGATASILPALDPNMLDAFYRLPNQVELHGIQADGSAARLVADAFGGARPEDSIALVAQAEDGISMVAFALTPGPLTLTPRDELLLSQAAAHVEATLRARLTRAPHAAVLATDGRILDATGPARERRVREGLADHVVTIERGRRASVRAHTEAIDAWTALLGGRYAVLEREDGARRQYHVVPNPPHVWSARALTHLEARVLELSARGMQGKLVAYNLGVSAAAVSRALHRGARKLGLGSREASVRLAAHVVRPDGLHAPARHATPAEREVLESLRRGWSNAAIAAARGTSERTVANQVQSLLRKHGAPSRRALTLAVADEVKQ